MFRSDGLEDNHIIYNHSGAYLNWPLSVHWIDRISGDEFIDSLQPATADGLATRHHRFLCVLVSGGNDDMLRRRRLTGADKDCDCHAKV